MTSDENNKEFNHNKMFDLNNSSLEEVVRMMYRDLHELKNKFDDEHQRMKKDIIELQTKFTVFSELNKSKPVHDRQWRDWIQFIITVAGFVITYFLLKK